MINISSLEGIMDKTLLPKIGQIIHKEVETWNLIDYFIHRDSFNYQTNRCVR